jgi:hypothetical protein
MVNNSELEREIKRLKGLKQNQDLLPEELEPIARVNIAVRDFKRKPLFEYNGDDKNIKKEVDQDQKLAEEKYKSYLESYEIESDSDLDTLSSLTYNEIFEKRIQRELNKLHDQGKYPPDRLTKQLTEVQNQKLSLKVKLGIDRKEEEKDDLTKLQLLEKRVFDHIQEHKNEHTIGVGWECEKCGHKDWEQYLLWYKVKDFKLMKHPWFVGRWLANYEILKDVKENKLSKEDATRYLMCASQGGDYKKEYKEYCTDYIDFCLEEWEEILGHFEKNLRETNET